MVTEPALTAEESDAAGADAGDFLEGFGDDELVSSWAKEALAWAVDAGIMSGVPADGTLYLQPDKIASRIQCATMIRNFCNNIVYTAN